MARKSHRDSAIRFVPAKPVPERATETRQYELFRPRAGQKESPSLGSTICHGQTWARKSHRDSAVRLVTAKRGPERATETRQYDLFRPRDGQKSHRDSAVRFVPAKSWPERATEPRQYDLSRANMGQKELPKVSGTICYGQSRVRKSHRDSAVRFVRAKRGPERATEARPYDLLRLKEMARKSQQDSAVRFVTDKRGPQRATKTRQHDLLRPNLCQKKPPRLGSTICSGQELARRATETGQYDLLRPNVGQKEPPRLTICSGQELARKSHQDSAVRFVSVKRGPERATETRQYDLLRPNVGNTIC